MTEESISWPFSPFEKLSVCLNHRGCIIDRLGSFKSIDFWVYFHLKCDAQLYRKELVKLKTLQNEYLIVSIIVVYCLKIQRTLRDQRLWSITLEVYQKRGRIVKK